jgi:NAD/NADP transhydrogenase alpha subunit
VVVTPALHTPLMSVTNAISGDRGGALLADKRPDLERQRLGARGGFIALIFAACEYLRRLLVTQRMLAMYRRGQVK